MKFPSLNKKTGLVFAAALTILSTIGCGGRSENVTPAADVKVSTAPVAAANSASRIPEGILKGKGLEGLEGQFALQSLRILSPRPPLNQCCCFRSLATGDFQQHCSRPGTCCADANGDCCVSAVKLDTEQVG